MCLCIGVRELKSFILLFFDVAFAYLDHCTHYSGFISYFYVKSRSEESAAAALTTDAAVMPVNQRQLLRLDASAFQR